MTSEYQQQLEELLASRLPLRYLQLLEAYPEALRNARRAIDDSASEGTVAEVELIADLQSVLEINLEVRADSVPEPGGLEFFWPEQFLVIGETGSGDYYCIDVNGDVEGVMQYDHQTVEFEVVADSMEEFVEMLVETFVDTADFSENDDSGTKD